MINVLVKAKELICNSMDVFDESSLLSPSSIGFAEKKYCILSSVWVGTLSLYLLSLVYYLVIIGIDSIDTCNWGSLHHIN